MTSEREAGGEVRTSRLTEVLGLLSEAQEDNADLRADLAEARKSVDELQDELVLLSESNASLRATTDDFIKLAVDQAEVNARLRAERDELREGVPLWKARIRELEAERDELRAWKADVIEPGGKRHDLIEWSEARIRELEAENVRLGELLSATIDDATSQENARLRAALERIESGNDAGELIGPARMREIARVALSHQGEPTEGAT